VRRAAEEERSEFFVSRVCPNHSAKRRSFTRSTWRFTKLVYVAPNQHILAGDRRPARWRFVDALRTGSIEVRKDWIVPGLLGEVFKDRFVTFENATRFLSQDDRPTAVVFGNDEMALEVYCAAPRLGLRIPNDLSVIGSDDFQAVSNVLKPKLTTMALPCCDIGVQAVKSLVGLLKDNSLKTLHTKIAASWWSVCRSCARADAMHYGAAISQPRLSTGPGIARD